MTETVHTVLLFDFVRKFYKCYQQVCICDIDLPKHTLVPRVSLVASLPPKTVSSSVHRMSYLLVECVLSGGEKVGVSFFFFFARLKAGCSPTTGSLRVSCTTARTRSNLVTDQRELRGLHVVFPPPSPLDLPLSHTLSRASLSLTHSPLSRMQ